VTTLLDLTGALEAVHALGSKVIVVTSVHVADAPNDVIDLIVSSPQGRFRVRTPLLPVAVNGAGDAIAALFFVHYLQTGDAGEALARAASSVYGLLKRTVEAGSREILLVEAQDEFVRPTTRFEAERI
jgi:pyridoxine kinase